MRAPPSMYVRNQSHTAASSSPSSLPSSSCCQPSQSYAEVLRSATPVLIRRSGDVKFTVTFHQVPRDSVRHSRGAFSHSNQRGSVRTPTHPHTNTRTQVGSVVCKGVRHAGVRLRDPVANNDTGAKPLPSMRGRGTCRWGYLNKVSPRPLPTARFPPSGVPRSTDPETVNVTNIETHTHAVSRGACRDEARPPGSAEVVSTRDPDKEWRSVPLTRHRRRKGQTCQQRVALKAPLRTATPKPAPKNSAKPSPKLGEKPPVPHDLRPLPLPEPFDKHEPHPSRNRRHQDEWNWTSWKEWLIDAAGRKWHKPSIRRVLRLRDQDPKNRSVDFSKARTLWNLSGWIYGLFHFASGRWYVGQTIRQYWFRAQQHWNSRTRLEDVLHTALANELSPFSFVVFPLEKIRDEL